MMDKLDDAATESNWTAATNTGILKNALLSKAYLQNIIFEIYLLSS